MLAAITLCATFATHAAPGYLDTAFGAGTGKVITPMGSGFDSAAALALQSDGKIIVFGSCSSNSAFCVTRHLPNGTLDTSFNSTGKAITPIGSHDDSARALALQPDGKIVVAGTCLNGPVYNFCLARYLPNGALDTSFNGNGKFFSVVGSGGSFAHALALQPDGKIIVAGYCYNGTADFCLARYLSSGAPDTSFGNAGSVITAIGSDADFAEALALQPDGKIVVAGHCRSNINTQDFCVARYLPTGALDASFNTTGTVVTTVGSSDDLVHAIALQPDGKIVVAGTCLVVSGYDFCLARYLLSGALDTSFNATGKVTSAIGSDSDDANVLALQPDGKIVVAGVCYNGSADFCVARYLPSGAPDTSFGNAGSVITAIGPDADHARALTLQPDGKIVAAGHCWNGSNYDFCLARYQGGPFDARICSMDIDGDNQTIATKDGLIATRVMLGLTGSAVIGGITFASHATRTTWPAIRDYLVSQCGMSIAP